MAFTLYTSQDAGGPGLIKGTVGDLNRVFRACLVNGYPGKTAAGWTEPIAETSNRAAFKQGTGSSGFHLFLNDNGPVSAGEANATGWESLLTLDAPVGTGAGQFPTPAQMLTDGHLVWWKSATADTTGRPWKMYADARTVLFFCDYSSNGDYQGVVFGDGLSYGATDPYFCIIAGAVNANSRSYSYNYMVQLPAYSAAAQGKYVARPYGGGSGSLAFSQQPGLGSMFNNGSSMNGYLSTPNPTDNSIWIVPWYILEPGVNAVIRGRYRGMWATPHSYASFTDGLVVQGSGQLAGRTFQAVRYMNNPWSQPVTVFVETSDTLDTL